VRYFIPLIHLLVALWVFYDSQKMGYTVWRGLLWAIGVFLVLILFLPLYLVARKKRQRLLTQAGQTPKFFPKTSCFYCGQRYEGDPPICPHCGQNLKIV
jgi:hypothetical protein